jgi:glycosyltransferase involved in cell wall biosynthesis
VIFNNGAFGGAAKRYTQLYIELLKHYPDDIYLFVNDHLFRQIKQIFPDINISNIRVVEKEQKAADNSNGQKANFYADHSPDPLKIDRETSFVRKIYWYYKNLFRQKNLFRLIENHRTELGIKVLVGVFSGGLPLVFYTDEKPRRASVIFANMDSWFSDVHSDMKKLWYRKFYSFNNIMEKADYVDFLSPYILEGIKKRSVGIKDEAVSVAPCSFIDYSKCSSGDKSSFEIAFSARLEPDKNPMLFLEAARVIHQKYPDVKFRIMGEGTLVKEIESFINENQLNGVIDFRFHKNPPEVFSNTSVFVSLQTGTNYPSQSVLEAMACGNAVIASNTGDTNLFINEDNGLLIEISLNELVNAIEKLINNKELTLRLGMNAREYAMKDHTAERYIGYFTELIKKAYSKIFNDK